MEDLTKVVDHDPAMMFDEQGRLFRWVRERDEKERVPRGCCQKAVLPSKHELDLIFVKQLDELECRLFDTLEVRTRAIRNWKKMRLLIVLLTMCGGRSVDMKRLEKNKEEEEPEDEDTR